MIPNSTASERAIATKVSQPRFRNFYTVDNVIHKHYIQHMGATGLAVYVGLCYQTGSSEYEVGFEMDELADATGVKPATVQRTLGLLERLGLVAVTSRFDDDLRIINVFNLLEPNPNGPPPDWKYRGRTRRFSSG
jgi:hypothetical protein